MITINNFQNVSVKKTTIILLISGLLQSQPSLKKIRLHFTGWPKNLEFDNLGKIKTLNFSEKS